MRHPTTSFPWEFAETHLADDHILTTHLQTSERRASPPDLALSLQGDCILPSQPPHRGQPQAVPAASAHPDMGRRDATANYFSPAWVQRFISAVYLLLQSGESSKCLKGLSCFSWHYGQNIIKTPVAGTELSVRERTWLKAFLQPRDFNFSSFHCLIQEKEI